MDRALWFVGAAAGRDATPADLRRSVPATSGPHRVLRHQRRHRDARVSGPAAADLAVDEALGALGGTFAYPFRYGYSCVGRVEATGPTSGAAVGDLVFAFQPHQERFVAAAGDMVPRCPRSTPASATLLPFVETALQVTLDAGSVLGDTVVVSGVGVLGVLVAVLLERAGAQVVAVEPQPWRRRLAGEVGLPPFPRRARCGARATGAATTACRWSIEASGNPAALDRGARSARPRGDGARRLVVRVSSTCRCRSGVGSTVAA